MKTKIAHKKHLIKLFYRCFSGGDREYSKFEIFEFLEEVSDLGFISFLTQITGALEQNDIKTAIKTFSIFLLIESPMRKFEKKLTPKEKDVLLQCRNGLSSRVMAELSQSNRRTFDKHRENVKVKAEIPGRLINSLGKNYAEFTENWLNLKLDNLDKAQIQIVIRISAGERLRDIAQKIPVTQKKMDQICTKINQTLKIPGFTDMLRILGRHPKLKLKFSTTVL